MGYCERCHLHYTASSHTCLDTKVCSTCHEEKPISAFPVHSSSFDGHRHVCAACLAIQKQTEKTRREQARAQRQEQQALLKAHGYHWKREMKRIQGYDDEWEEEVWQLYTPRWQKTTIEQALQTITRVTSPNAPQGNIEGVRSWARDLLLCDPLFLDTETTGIGTTAEVIDLAIVDKEGIVLADTLLRCQGEIEEGAIRKHHITPEMLTRPSVPAFPDVWLEVGAMLARRDVVIFNASFDTRLLAQTAERYGLIVPSSTRFHCLMLKYAEYVGERNGQGYRSQPLDRARAEFSLSSQHAHRALYDADIARRVMLQLAAPLV